MFVLIELGAIAIGPLVWSIFSLMFGKWGRMQAMSNVNYTTDPHNGIEVWLAVTIGRVPSLFGSLDAEMCSAGQVALLIFYLVDCCARRTISG